MHRVVRVVTALAFVAVAAIGFSTHGSAAPPVPQPVTIPCATNVSAQVFGNAQPATATGQALVLVRITFGPGGGIGPHTHPGTLVASVASGTLGFTLIGDGTMPIMRSGEAGTPAVEELAATGQEVELNAGDWFVETGMIPSARTIGDEPAVVTISGLIEAGQALTQCVEGTPTP
jgi:quercetin dioxygenase-like cupin family protein